jgi:YHS domain-containing protein
VTGGAAAMSLSYQGKSYPICCSGCRDEFLESPDKYLKKLAAATAEADAPKSGGGKKPAPAKRPRGDDDAFSGDVDEPKAKP